MIEFVDIMRDVVRHVDVGVAWCCVLPVYLESTIVFPRPFDCDRVCRLKSGY